VSEHPLYGVAHRTT